MARTIEQIKQAMIDAVAADATLSTSLTSTSGTAMYRLMIYITASGIWVLETLFDFFKADVNEIIASQKPHSLRWYAAKAKEYQHGFNLVADADYYDNTNIAPALVAASKIVTYAAVVEQEKGLRIKVAKTSGTDLVPLNVTELNAFKAYMKRVKDAGVKLNITSTNADALRLALRIKYNALVLNSSGARIDGTTATPVKDAIKNYLKNLPFNGVFSTQKLVDAIQAVEGVVDVAVDVVQTQYGLLPFTNVNIDTTPDSGYLVIADADLTLNYIAG